MKTNWLKFAGALSMVFAAASVPGCSAGSIDDDFGSDENASIDEDMEIGSMEQGLMTCTNPDGTNSAMAAFAVAIAQDLGRWQAGKDFVVYNTSGAYEGAAGAQQAIKLQTGTDSSGKPRGKSLCADAKCARVQALLDMQYEQANNKVYFQGSGSTKVLLSPSALRSRMVAKLGEQTICDSSAKDNSPTSCPVEQHKLTFVSATSGGCDKNFTFHATKPDGTALGYPGQLKQKVKFADVANPYINFVNLGGGNVSIDPTYGVNDDGTTSTGSLIVACTKISTTSMVGVPCSCGGLTKAFAKSGWSATTFLCQ
jgi:hypothetical protein